LPNTLPAQLLEAQQLSAALVGAGLDTVCLPAAASVRSGKYD